MMDIVSAISKHIREHVNWPGHKVFPHVASGVLDTFVVIKRLPSGALAAHDGVDGLTIGTVSITVWSNSYDTACAVAKLVGSLLEGFGGIVGQVEVSGIYLTTRNSIIDQYGMFGEVRDFRVGYKEV
jgi:hypothetical protein